MKYISFLFILLVVNTGFSQEKFTLSGTVNDNSSNETIIGANIIVKDLKQGATTNEYGFYSLTLPAGKYTIQISAVGFLMMEQEVDLSVSQSLEFQLKTEADEKELEEVAVIEPFLPKQLSAEELKAEIQKVIDETGATSMKDMGKVMGAANARLNGRADGRSISETVKALLS